MLIEQLILAKHKTEEIELNKCWCLILNTLNPNTQEGKKTQNKQTKQNIVLKVAHQVKVFGFSLSGVHTFLGRGVWIRNARQAEQR